MFPTMSMGNFQIVRPSCLLDNSNMANPTLKEIVAERLRELDRNPFDAAKRVGLERSYLNDILIGKKTSVRNDKVPVLALALDMAPNVLFALLNPGGDSKPTPVRVMGRIGAGAEIMPEFEQLPPEGLFEIETIVPVPPGSIAFEVEGDSMWPRYDPGDVVLCWREGTNAEEVVGWEAAVRTADGRRYLKRILKGSAPGTFDLESHNGPPIRGVKLDWVAHVGMVVRAGQWSRLSNGERARLLKKSSK